MSPQAATAWTGFIVLVASIIMAVYAWVSVGEGGPDERNEVEVRTFKTRVRWAWGLLITAGVLWIVAIWAEALVIQARGS